MILIIDNHSGNLNKIKSILKKYNQNYLVKEQSSLFKKSKNIKGIILTGGSLILDKKIMLSKIRADVSSIINYDVPILGICLGHELIAELCGAEVVKLKTPIKDKEIEIKILKRKAIFKDLPEKIVVWENHSRYLRAIPNSFNISATSGKSKTESLFHKTRPIFTVQFHAEESHEMGEKIIKNFLDIVKDFNS